MKIRVGIAGYGNIGKGAELAVSQCPDMELAAIFTRRDPCTLRTMTPNVPIMPLDEAKRMKGEIDVMMLAGGSATDLPEQGPMLAALFNTVDSFDNHVMIPDYHAKMNQAATSTAAVISAGWDPGLFSLFKLLGSAFLPNGSNATFWGRGVSQGHSDALRRIEGVKNAVQYTVPLAQAITDIRGGAEPESDPKRTHRRECFIVPEEGANHSEIEQTIRQMPNYFAGYDTVINFITQEELQSNHTGMPHGGNVFRSGSTGGSNRHLMELSLQTGSNPEYTASIMTAYARAAVRMAREGCFGAKTVFDIPFSYLSPMDWDILRMGLL